MIEKVYQFTDCLLYTSDAADDLLCVDLGGCRINKKKKPDKEEPTKYVQAEADIRILKAITGCNGCTRYVAGTASLHNKPVSHYQD